MADPAPWEDFVTPSQPPAGPWQDFAPKADQPPAASQREGGLMQTVPKAAELAASPEGRSALFKGFTELPTMQAAAQSIPGGAHDVLYNVSKQLLSGLIEPFFNFGKAASGEPLTPEQETEAGFNAAMLTMGGGGIPRIMPSAAIKAVAPVMQEFDAGVMHPAAARLDAFARTGDPNGVRLEPPGPEVKPAPVRPIEGSPFAGVPRSVAARTGIPEVDRVLQSPVTQSVIDNAVIDRSHDVPYMAGGSEPLNDPTVYIDKHVPKEQTVGGVTFDPAEPWSVHENVEQHTMDLLTRGGMTDAEAYRVAHFEYAEPAEQAWYTAHGIDQVAAEKEQASWLPRIQHEDAADVPANLFKKPYPDGEVGGARHEHIAEARPTPDEIQRARDIIQNAPELQPRSSSALVQEARDLGVIGPDRAPLTEEKPAVAAARSIPASRAPDDKITMTPAGQPLDAWQQRFEQWVDRIKEPDDVKQLIRDAAEQNNNFPDARAGEINPAHVEKLAESGGVDPASVDIKQLRSKFNNPDQIRMAKQLMDQQLDNFRKAADAVTADPSEPNLLAMQEALMKRDYGIEYILGLRSEWGKSGHALRELLEKAKEEQGLTDFLKDKGRSIDDLRDLANGMKDLDRTTAARVLTNARGQPTHWFYWTWVQGLISGLITHTKYVAANTFYAGMERGLVTPIASIIGGLKRAAGSEADRVFIGETPMGLVGNIAAVPDAFITAFHSVKSGMRVPMESEVELRQLALDRGEKLPPHLDKPFLPAQGIDSGFWGRIPFPKFRYAAYRFFGSPGDMAMGIHTVFKVMGQRSSLESLAYAKAAEEGLSPSTGEFWNRQFHHYNNPSEDMLKESVYQAYKGTFMQELGPRAKYYQGLLQKIPGLKWLAPFAHIPINLMKATQEYTPLAIFNKDMRADILGQNGGRAQDMVIARMTVGSAVMGWFAHKYFMGEATGDFPRDPKEQREWQLEGKQPNSFKWGNEWVSFDRFGPAGDLARNGANIGSIVHHFQDDLSKNNKDLDEALTHATFLAAASAMSTITDEVGFQSIKNMFEASGDERKGTRWAAWQAGSFLPMSSAISQTSSVIDPYQRRAQSFIDGLRYRMPGLREGLMPKRDPLYGSPLPNPGYHSILRSSPINTDPVKIELSSVDYHPGPPKDTIGGVKLPPKLYDEYQATAGPLVHQALDAMIRRPGWDHIPAAMRADTYRAVVGAMRQRAAATIQMAHPEIVQMGISNAKARITGEPPGKLQ